MTTLSTSAFRANALARRFVYRSPLVARLLYGARFEPYQAVSFWELGSLAMREALRRDLRSGQRALEIGTGPYATLALWAQARWTLDLTATEIDEDWAAWARRHVRANRGAVDVRCCDLFDGIDGTFDAIWFVAPYTPAATFAQQAAGVADADARSKLRVRTCGGDRGWELIDRYLGGVRSRLRPGGRAYFSVNRVHQSVETMRGLVQAHGLRVVRETSLPVVPVVTIAVSAPVSA
jgi:methylase of polypeptide subunit release factors